MRFYTIIIKLKEGLELKYQYDYEAGFLRQKIISIIQIIGCAYLMEVR